jgi:sialidase-1
MEFSLIEDHREDPFRSGEGSVVELKDGRLMLMYTAFRDDGHADHSPAEIWARFSSDAGRMWSELSVIFQAPEGALNVMSPSLLRLTDGRIGCVFAVKWDGTHCVPFWTSSIDEGKNWADPQPMTAEAGYFCINNDRLIQLRDGTLVMPYAQHKGMVRFANDKELLKEWLNAWCGILHSRDGGETWEMPDTARKYEKEWHVAPDPLCLELMPPLEQRAVREKYDVLQEPGVIELRDGRLMMWARSLSHVFHSFASNKDGSWSDYKVIAGMNVSCSPQTIKRVPLTDDLVMLYNDRGEIPFGSPCFQDRTPLSVAISKDEGQSWQKVKALESDTSKNYCYAGLCFFAGKFLATYYESADACSEDGSPKYREDGTRRQRNLASLKMCCGEQFELFRAAT